MDKNLSEHEQKLESMFVGLRTSYALTLPKKIKELEFAVQRAQKQPDNQVFFQYACMQAHRLSGTIGSYGFLELGKVIAEIESSLESLRQSLRERSQVRGYWRQIDPVLKQHFSSAITLADKLASMNKK